MWTHTFWIASVERAVKTFTQTLAAVLLASNVPGLLDADWSAALSASALASLLSILTSIGSATVGNDGPSLAGEDLER